MSREEFPTRPSDWYRLPKINRDRPHDPEILDRGDSRPVGRILGPRGETLAIVRHPERRIGYRNPREAS